MRKRRKRESRKNSKKNLTKMLALPFMIFLALALFAWIAYSASLAEFVSSCAAEDLAAKGSFGSPCDDITGAYLEKDDGMLESHQFDKGSTKYAGVRIQSVNTSTTDCANITDVFICYEWWYTGTRAPKNCDVSVDADGGANYTAVTTACPGTILNPGINCTNITTLESWTCTNFFGPTGTKAFAKSELTRATAGPNSAQTAYWDVLYFNVSYIKTGPNVTIIYPQNGATYNTILLFIRANVSGESIDSCWYDLNGVTNTTTCGAEPNITVVEGLNNLTYYANNTDGAVVNDSTSFTVNSSIPLTITITSPANGTIGTAATPKLKLLAIDKNYISVNYTLDIFYENDTLYAVGNNGTLANNTELEITLTPALNLIGNLTTYKIITNATDTGGNNATSNILYYTLTLPAVTLINPDNNYWDSDGNISFSFKVLDEAYPAANCSLYLDGTLNQTNNQTPTNNTPIIFNVTGISEGASKVWKIECKDPSNNTGYDSRTFNVDKTSPIINWINDTPDPVNENQIINITSNVTDNLGIKDVIVNISDIRYYMFHSTGNIYYFEFNTSGLNGMYDYTVEASDNVNNNATPKTGNFTVVGTSPTSNSPPDQTADIGEETTIEWTLHDDVGPASYFVEKNSSLFAGPANWQNNTLITIRPNNYFLCTWNYTISYNDSLGNDGIPDTVLVTVIDNTTPSCDLLDDPNKPTLTNITVDGDMSDWDPVLSNPLNYVIDESSGAGDLDIVQTADRDLVEFAYTWNDQYLNLYFRRLHQGNNQLSVIAYIDYDLDGYMNTTDQVVKFVWSGSNQQYDSDLYNYIPAGTADLMNGSGYDMPGSITLNKSLETNVVGGTNPGISLETRVLWSDLGFSGPAPLNFQPASALGPGTGLPSQLEDNVDTISSSYTSLLFQADQSRPATNATSVYYDYDLMNCGNLQELIDFTNISSQGWNVTLYYPNGTMIIDTDSDNKADVTLDAYNYTTIIVKIDIPSTTPAGTVDVTTTTATSSITPTYSKSVTATTSVGQITIVPYQEIISGTAGMIAVLNYTVYNYQAFNDTIEINASSSQGWNGTIFYANGSNVVDTDSDGYLDLGDFLSGESKTILLFIDIPSGAAAGTNDLTTITINSSANPSLSTNALADTTVKSRLTLDPDYNRSVGIGDSTFYNMTITQNWNESDVIDLEYTNVSNYDVELLAFDMITPLTDTDSDSIIDTGPVAGYGTEFNFYIKITTPSNASEGDSELNIVYANSSLDASVYNTSRINTTVRILITYEDAAHSNEEINFEIGDTVYARAHSLLAVNNVYYQWIGPNATFIKTSADIPVSAEDNSDDSLDTNTSLPLGNWTVVVFNAQNDVELGRAIFYLLDTTPPNVTLNYPPPDYCNDTHDLVNMTFNCSVTDNYQLVNISLYITNSTNGSFSLNQTVNISGIINNTNWTLELTEEDYTWNCRAYDSSGNDDWGDANRTIRIFIPVVSFTLTLPGESPVAANKTQNGTTAVMFFNSSTNTNYDIDPCVKSTGTCQNSTVPFFVFQNTGNVDLSWTVNLNETLPAEIALQANDQYNGTNATNITTSAYNLSDSVAPANTSDAYFFADCMNAHSANRTLTHEGVK